MDPLAVSRPRGQLSTTSDLTAEEKAVVARFRNTSFLPANRVAGGSVWQQPSLGAILLLPGMVCAELVTANILASAWVVKTTARYLAPDFSVLALLDAVLLACSMGVVLALARRGKSRARRTAVAGIVAFVLSLAFLLAIAGSGSQLGLDTLLGFGAAALVIPMAAAGFSITRAFQLPRETPPLIGPHDINSLEGGAVRLRQG